jgi:hypothetical protein
MRTPLAALERVRFECPSEVLCTCCHVVLDRHQPDDERPDRLLGTCPGCGAWFLIDAEACVMYGLPDVTEPKHD